MNKTNTFIKSFKTVLEKSGGKAYLVGGYIRDKLINPRSNPKDMDFIYDGNIDKLISELKGLEYNIFPIKESIGIYRIIEDEITVDISKMKGKNIEEDLSKRDFTINSICMDITENKIIDPFKGRNYIESRIIHNVSENSLEDDPVRILRGIRLYINYGMHFSLITENKVVDIAPRLKECVKERVFNEFMKIIQFDREGKAIQILDDYNILRNMFPYIDELKAIGKCKYHLEDTYTHMNLTYETFKNVLNNRIQIDNFDINLFDKFIGNFKLREYIALACFLHDIGKFNCYKNDEDRISFYGHEVEGGKISKGICEDMVFPKEATELIEVIVSAHMYPLGLFKSDVKDIKKALYKFFSKYDKYIIPIVIVSFCDVYATKMIFDPNNEKQAYKEFMENILNEYKCYLEIKNNRILNGNDIIRITNKKGPIIKKIIEEIDKQRYLGKINSKEDSIYYLLHKAKF